MTKPIINTAAEYKLVREALQQDLKDKNDKISKLESDNLELINKVNNLMEKNLDLHEKNIKSIQSKDEQFNSNPQVNLLENLRNKQGPARRKTATKGTIFGVEEFESGGKRRGGFEGLGMFVTKSENLREKTNFQDVFNKPNKFDQFINDNLHAKNRVEIGRKMGKFKSERMERRESETNFFDAMPQLDHENLISQILPVNDEKADKSGFSRKNEEDILKGLVSYLENNVYSQNQPKTSENSKQSEFEYIKHQIEKYLDVSGEKLSKPKEEALLMNVMTSFGKVAPTQSQPRQTTPKKHSKNNQKPVGAFESNKTESDEIDIKKFQSLEQKYNDLIRLNQETQEQIQELRRERSLTLTSKTTQPARRTRETPSNALLNKDELFKKMHEASIEMVVNRESRIFSTSSKKETHTETHSVKKRKDMSASSEYLYSNIDQIYQEEGAQDRHDKLEEPSVKLSGTI